MKTLDEVIKALEICSTHKVCVDDCPYYKNGCIEFGTEKDALHYLKELRHILDNTVWVNSTKEETGYWKLPTLPETGNDPLTWDELKQMEGKPVWLEWTGEPSWGFVDYFTEDFIFFDVPHSYLKFEKKLKGQTWQAYRKERE